MFVVTKLAECHDTCLDVVGSDGHTTNVNPVEGTDDWRVDCDSCFTCISAHHKTKAAARDAAVAHVIHIQGVPA